MHGAARRDRKLVPARPPEVVEVVVGRRVRPDGQGALPVVVRGRDDNARTERTDAGRRLPAGDIERTGAASGKTACNGEGGPRERHIHRLERNRIAKGPIRSTAGRGRELEAVARASGVPQGAFNLNAAANGRIGAVEQRRIPIGSWDVTDNRLEVEAAGAPEIVVRDRERVQSGVKVSCVAVGPGCDVLEVRLHFPIGLREEWDEAIQPG